MNVAASSIIKTYEYKEKKKGCMALPLTFFLFRGRLALLAVQLGNMLEYSPGRLLVDHVTRYWADEFSPGHDFLVVTGDDLHDLRTILKNDVSVKKTETSLGAKAPSAMILYETGVNKALLLTKKPAGKKLRHWLAQKVLPEMARTGSYQGPTMDPAQFLDLIRTELSAVKAEYQQRLREQEVVHQAEVMRLAQIAGQRIPRDEYAEECQRRRDRNLLLMGHLVKRSRNPEVRALGGIWDERLRSWLLPDEAALAEALRTIAGIDKTASATPPLSTAAKPAKSRRAGRAPRPLRRKSRAG